jgi:hypothetical protein
MIRIRKLGLGPSSEFGFEKPLLFFELLPDAQETDLNQVRLTLGFGYPALLRQEKLLPFFRLLPKFGSLPVPHNRQVEDGGPTYRRPLPFKSFWPHHF